MPLVDPLSSIGSISRRSLLGASGAALSGLLLDRYSGALAQGSSGSISVGYEGSMPFVGHYVEIAAQTVMAANPGASVEVFASNAPNYLNQIALQLMMGNAPDVFLLPGLGSGELGQAGLIRPLDEYLNDWDGWTHYDPVVREGVAYQDQHWSVPWGVNLYFLFYRKDFFADAGLPEVWQPEKPDEILDMAEAMAIADPGVVPFSLYAGANGETGTGADFLNLILSYGGTLTNDEGKWYIDSCPIRQTVGFYEAAFQTRKVIPQSVLTDIDPLQTIPHAFGNGELAILHEQVQQYGRWIGRDPVNTERIGLAHFPGSAGPFAFGDVGNAWYIGKRSKDPDLAWAFIEAFQTPEIQAALAADDPHLPARLDARELEVWTSQPLAETMLAVADGLTIPPAEPQFRKLIEVVQNATGLVATGQANPTEAVDRYAEQLTRTMGETNVVSEPCP